MDTSTSACGGLTGEAAAVTGAEPYFTPRLKWMLKELGLKSQGKEGRDIQTTCEY